MEQYEISGNHSCLLKCCAGVSKQDDLNYQLKHVDEPGEDFATLKQECLASLSAPPDGMWEAFRAAATHWGIYQADELVGFGLVDDQDQLIQFYLLGAYLPDRLSIFKMLLQQAAVSTGIVGTHQPVFLSTALHYAKEMAIHTYLFEHEVDQQPEAKEGQLQRCEPSHLEAVTEFCHYSLGAPKRWLRTYLGGLIKQGALYKLTQGNTIVGTCEVRDSAALPDRTDIGMIVSPDFRRQGYGAFLLGQAKSIAQSRSKAPICSCEANNVGSLKAIQTNGFRTKHQLLKIQFSALAATLD